MIVIRLFVFLWIPILAKGVINITFQYSECKGEIASVTDRGVNYDDINSTCNCTITSNSTGKLYFWFNECTNKIDILNSNGTGNELSCYGGELDVQQGQQFFIILKNADSSMAHSGNFLQIISIFARICDSGSFSVTCGPVLENNKNSLYSSLDSNRAATKDTADVMYTKSAIRNYSNVTLDTSDHHVNTLKAEFPYMYVVAGGSILVVVVLVVFMVVCIRRESHHRSKQQLPDNLLYHAYKENEDVANSTCGNENQSSTEQLPDNPLYHSYQIHVIEDKQDSKSEKHMSVILPSQGEMPSIRNINTSENVSYSSAVYAQLNKTAKVSNANQDESTDIQNETIYAQVSKPKKQ